MDLPATKFVIKDLLPQRLAIIGGSPKVGKTSPQQIDIYFRYIGTFALPSTTDKAEGNKHDERRTA